MAGLDYAVFAVVAATTALASWRGLVREVVALAGWVLAAWVALTTWGSLDAMLAPWIDQSMVRAVVAFAAVFLAVLIASGFAAVALARLVRLAGFGVADRVLGGVFGLVKGMAVVVLLVVLAGLTGLPQQPWWRDSVLAAPLADAVLALRPWLPEELSKRLRFAPAGEGLQAGLAGG